MQVANYISDTKTNVKIPLLFLNDLLNSISVYLVRLQSTIQHNLPRLD